MRKFLISSAVVGLAFVLSGCAVTQMEAKVVPVTDIAISSIGHEQRVGVVVTDERPTQDIGKRAPGGAAIQMTSDLATIYQTAIIDGLNREGFKASGGKITGSNLKVEIRGLAYEVSTGWWTGGD